MIRCYTRAVVILSGALLAVGPVSASDGEITIVGNVIAETCDIDGNGDGGPNFTVTLPTVGVSAFRNLGDLAGQMPFYIGLSGDTCTAGAAALHFEAHNADLLTGDLKNVEVGGSNVQVRITDSSNRQINVGNNAGSPWFDLINGKARMDYRVHYVATAGQASAGAVRTVARYTVIYR